MTIALSMIELKWELVTPCCVSHNFVTVVGLQAHIRAGWTLSYMKAFIMGVKVEDDDVISIKVGDNTGSFHLPATEGALWQLFHCKKVWIFSNLSAIKQWQFVTVECIVYSNFFFFCIAAISSWNKGALSSRWSSLDEVWHCQTCLPPGHHLEGWSLH